MKEFKAFDVAVPLTRFDKVDLDFEEKNVCWQYGMSEYINEKSPNSCSAEVRISMI